MAELSVSDSGLPVSILLEHVRTTRATTSGLLIATIIDESNGLFGDWYSSEEVMEMLLNTPNANANVGVPMESLKSLRSQNNSLSTFWNMKTNQAVTPHEMPLEIHNSCTTHRIRIRWVDNSGKIYPWLYQWDLAPSSTWEQYSKPGHLFLISLIQELPIASGAFTEQEVILAAYRTKRALPSLSAHCVFIHGDFDAYGSDGSSTIGLEMLLLEESKMDALSVAASDLDHHHQTPQDRIRILNVVHFLQTIFGNLIREPNEEKYHRLRLGNSKIQSLVKEWGALQILTIIGFGTRTDDTGMEENLVLAQLPVNRHLCQLVLDFLLILANRLHPSFILDLAPPTPWQEVYVASTSTSSWGNGSSQRGGFITDEEKWARAERIAKRRRSGAARRPEPGQAPSSKGKWGR
jgi:hypothetical protein